MTKEKRKDTLQSLLNFTDEDLEANRQGVMTEAQARHLNMEGFAQSSFFVLGTLLFASPFGWAYLNGYQPPDFDAFCFIAVFILFIGFGLIIWTFEGEKYKIDWQQKTVLKAEGTIRLDRFGRDYRLHIGEEIFNIPRHLNTEFEKRIESEPKWIIYYTPKSRAILSVERVPD